MLLICFAQKQLFFAANNLMRDTPKKGCWKAACLTDLIQVFILLTFTPYMYVHMYVNYKYNKLLA